MIASTTHRHEPRRQQALRAAARARFQAPLTDDAPRPTLADIFRRYARRYRRQYGWRLTPQQDRALREIEVCRTRVLGGHVEQCAECRHAEYHWNSCRNRHCPRCGGYRRHQWYEDRLAEMLVTPYAHLVFTLPETLSELAEHNGPLIYNLLFTAASQALLYVARTWTHLKVDTGFIAVLHSWGQLLLIHIHCHILWPLGGLTLDGTAWRSLPHRVKLPKAELRKEFRTRFLDGLQKASDRGELVLTGRHGHLLSPQRFAQWIAGLRACYWNIHAERVEREHAPEQTPAEAARCTLGYLAAYANGVALHNDRLLAIEDDHVVFSYKDYRNHGRQEIARVPALEFIDRFLLHVLPRHVRRIRNYGFLAPNQRGEKLPLIRQLLGMPELGSAPEDAEPLPEEQEGADAEGSAIGRPCPVCQVGVLLVISWPRPSIAQITQLPLEQLRQSRLPFQ